jgi:hypothetical protein
MPFCSVGTAVRQPVLAPLHRLFSPSSWRAATSLKASSSMLQRVRPRAASMTSASV